MPVKIKALEQAIAQRQTVKAEDRKSWFTAANEKTRPMTDMIDRAIKQQRAAQPTMEQPKTQNQEKFTKAQERPERRTTYSEVREKTRAEAEIKRARVPPEYRAEPYEAKTNAPRAEEPQTKNQSAFSSATTAENEPKPTKPRMSDTFNMKSGSNATAESEPEQRPNETPEADI